MNSRLRQFGRFKGTLRERETKAIRKLSDKASKLDFSNLPGLAPLTPVISGEGEGTDTGDSYKPKTAPGAMMAFAADARSELVRENERLKSAADEALILKAKVTELAADLAQWDGACATRQIDPKQIRRSKWANRHEHSFSDPDFLALKEEILNAGGNIQPIKIRLVGKDDGGDVFEIVFGHRRHQACLDLNLRVLATIENLSDQGLFVEMDRENRSRKNLSPWEQGKMYLKALDDGLFSSQRKLSEAVGIDLSALGKALNLARLPSMVVQAFQSPLDIQYRWAKPLTDALAQDGNGVLARAESLSAMNVKPSAKIVFEHLVKGGPLGGRTVPPPTEATVIKTLGKQVGVLNVLPDGSVNVQFKSGVLPKTRVADLAKLISDFLRQV